MLEAAMSAFGMIMEPSRLLILMIAVIIGLVIGVIPGMGGIVGLAILIPFTYAMDPFAAFAFLIGMAAVTTTSDTIPAVLFGVPGTSGSAATVMDGYPMAKNGEAGRAFGAAYSASLIGGVVGAIILAVSIPVIRPIMLYIGSPELFMLTILGISMVASLSGGSVAKGIAAGAIGLVLAMVGMGSQGGTLRWTFGQLYLWDGLPLVPITLGLFALPEMIDMAITRSKIAKDLKGRSAQIGSQWQGIKDTFIHWWLTLRCSALGTFLGAVPGLGSAVVDWLAYGHAQRSEKNTERFGKGDVRGVIGPESANNSKTGGTLIPTLAFGVPGSASMALLLGAFMMHGLIPGPDMLSRNLDVTYGIIWSLALANIIGAGLCLVFANQFAKVALVRFGILVPIITVVIFLGAFQSSVSWGDIATLLIAGGLGWIMKRLDWPRAPLLLGFVLGTIFERYLWISVNISLVTTGSPIAWITRPAVIILIALTVWGIFQGAWPWLKKTFILKEKGSVRFTIKPRINPNAVFSFLVLTGLLYLQTQAQQFSFNDRVVPMASLLVAIACTCISLFASLFTYAVDGTPKISEELGNNWGWGLVNITAWILGFSVLIWIIGFMPAIFFFLITFMVLVGKEKWRNAIIISTSTTVFCYVVFHLGVNVNWIPSLLGDMFPELRQLTRFI